MQWMMKHRFHDRNSPCKLLFTFSLYSHAACLVVFLSCPLCCFWHHLKSLFEPVAGSVGKKEILSALETEGLVHHKHYYSTTSALNALLKYGAAPRGTYCFWNRQLNNRVIHVSQHCTVLVAVPEIFSCCHRWGNSQRAWCFGFGILSYVSFHRMFLGF